MITLQKLKIAAGLWLALPPLLAVASANAQSSGVELKPVPVKIVSEKGAFHLLRDGRPYFIKGAGGDGSKTLLRDIGGNSFRTWGADDLGKQLDEAQKLGLTVTIGIWLGHIEHGFNYNNADQVAEQYEKAKQAILKYRNHPALLMWGIGNEMEGYEKGDNAAIWSAVNNIAALAHRLDPNHPTMTVIAEIGGDKIKSINRLCPDIDVVGVNSYGGSPTLAKRYADIGGVKPYVVTEFAQPGTWETGKNAFGMTAEMTSTEKAERYRKTWKEAIDAQRFSLGGYAFAWGNKQEATATWFGMMLPDGSRLGAVDAMQECWTGKAPPHRCPNLDSLKLTAGSDQVDAGATIEAALEISAPDGDPLKVEWVLSGESKHLTSGDTEPTPPTYKEAILESDLKRAKVKMPKIGGNYRLFAYVRDTHGGAAVANIPLLVRGGTAETVPAKSAKLPLTVYAEGGEAVPFTPSGYMGSAGAIKMNESYKEKPHSGKTCLEVSFTAKDGWGGVVWQDPANDWGDKAGGANLTGATKLTFWARGEKGGEKVAFLCGVIAKEKPFYDTAQAKLAVDGLTKEWKQYTIDLQGKDMSRIKTGFGWTLAATGEPVTFCLDDIRYE